VPATMALPHRGLNLPPTQGSSNAGAFLPGVYRFDYPVETLGDIKQHGVDSVRLLINAASACDEACCTALHGYLKAVDGRGVLCLFDTICEGDAAPDSHGTGRICDMEAYVEAWRCVHAAFGGYADLFYEVFNEPFGYPEAELYLDDMREVIARAGLPMERCVIDGLSYASDVQSVQAAGWPGALGYHFYPMWLNTPGRTQEGFSDKLQSDLRDLSHKTLITEFGGALNQGDVYETYHESGEDDFSNVNCLRGMRDAVGAFDEQNKQVLGLYYFHGWHNGDSYDFWDEANSFGKACVQDVLAAVKTPSVFEPGAESFGLFRLRGLWAQGTACISGGMLHWGGESYALSEVDAISFQIAGEFGGGSATFTSEEITWANGEVWTRFNFPVRGFWAEGAVQIAGAKLHHKGLDPALYALSNITADSFDISSDYGGGSATYTPEQITWANGTVYSRA